MKFDLSREEYGNALKSALDVIDAGAERAGTQAMEQLLANTWDSIAYANITECLMVMDSPTRDIALALIIGRAYFGRPSNLTCSTELERNFQKVFQKQIKTSGGEAPN